MKAFVAFVASYVGGMGILYGLWARLWTFDELLWVFTPFMVLALAYGAARAVTGHPSRVKWRPRCALTGRFLPQTIYSGKARNRVNGKHPGLSVPFLGHPPRRLEHVLNQPSPYSIP